MEYKIDPSAYGSVFVLPKSLVENHIKLASGAFLKVLLFAFCHAGEPLNAAAAAEAVGISPEEAADALLYWKQRGCLMPADAPAAEVTAAPAPEPPAAEPPAEAKQVVNVKPARPSYETICSRLAEDAAVRVLFSEAQLKLGRTIGTADQASLLLLYDYYGLPVEVILAICEYARLHNKERNMGYIYTVGVDWSRREIDSLEAAEEEINRLNSIDRNWPEFRRVTGVTAAYPTAAQQKYLAAWLGDWRFGFDMISAAYDETVKNTGKMSFPYMNKILSVWRSEGVDTPEKAAAREQKFREEALAAAAKKANKSMVRTAPKNKQTYDTPASYDIDLAEHKMNTTVPKHKKKEKR